MDLVLALGHDHHISFTWLMGQDRATEKPNGGIVRHKRKDGATCEYSIVFDGEWAREHMPNRTRWTVESWEPLTLSPSLRCLAEGCGDHGFIKQGKWVPA